MEKPSFIDDLARQLESLLPNKAMTEDMRRAVRQVVQSAFARLDLVTREEFDAQQAVLARTRQQVEQLEATLAELQREASSGNQS
jgi:ubiquinone biosynthesis accessory factor UbiK